MIEGRIWKIKSFEELTRKELYEILKIRQEVFVVRQTCYYLDADGADEHAVHVWAKVMVRFCRTANFRTGDKIYRGIHWKSPHTPILQKS